MTPVFISKPHKQFPKPTSPNIQTFAPNRDFSTPARLTSHAKPHEPHPHMRAAHQTPKPTYSEDLISMQPKFSHQLWNPSHVPHGWCSTPYSSINSAWEHPKHTWILLLKLLSWLYSLLPWNCNTSHRLQASDAIPKPTSLCIRNPFSHKGLFHSRPLKLTCQTPPTISLACVPHIKSPNRHTQNA